MLCSAKYIKKELEDHNVIEKAYTNFPEYNLVITGMNTTILSMNKCGIINLLLMNNVSCVILRT